MKITSILLIIVLFAGCAELSSTRPADDSIKLPKTGYSFGEITAYPPVSRTDSPWWLLRARKGNKWGYVDSLRGHILIPFVYDFADDLVDSGFSRQYARVQLDGKWGFINYKGERVIPFLYDHADQFTHNKGDFLAKVSRGGRTFMINTSGVDTKPSNWCEIISDSDVWVENKLENLLRVNCDGKFGFASELRQKRSPLIRYYNSEMFKVVIPVIYHEAEDFRTLMVNGNKINLARVGLNGYGFINEKGDAVIPAIYDSVDMFTAMPAGSEKYIARAELKKKFGYINEKGETIIPFIHESAGSFHNGISIAVKDSVAVQREGKRGFIDYTGRTAIPIIYDRIDHFQRLEINGKEMLVAMAQRDGKWGLIDSTGKETIPIVYDRISSFKPVEIEGRETLVAKVMQKGLYGFMDTAGKVIIPLEYEQARPFQTLSIGGRRTDISMARRDGKWGFIDATGKILIPFKYEDVNEFHERDMRNIARVKSGGKWIYIDDSGKQVRPTVNFSSESAVSK